MESKIAVVGIGPGSPDYLIPAASRAIAEATLLVGSQRALTVFAAPGVQTKVIDRDIAGVLAFIRAKRTTEKVAVLVSGDPGFYSMLAALKREFTAAELLVIPGISSMQLAFARLAEVWQDAQLLSMHGREVDAEALQYQLGKKLGFLTDGKQDTVFIAQTLLAHGWPAAARAAVCRSLSYEDEEIIESELGAVAARAGEAHCVLVVRG